MRCSVCTKDAVPGGKMCEGCRSRYLKDCKKRRERQRALGKCIACSRDAVPGKSQCQAHIDAQVRRSAVAHYRNKYGLTHDEAKKILARGCEICGEKRGKLCIDHDHVTGTVRGCLCHHCNTGFGHFKESVALLNRAIAYAERTHGSTTVGRNASEYPAGTEEGKLVVALALAGEG